MIEREQTFQREVIIWLGSDRQQTVQLPRLPHLNEAARIILWFWDAAGATRSDMDRMTLNSEKPHLAILWVQWGSLLGNGGWESDITLGGAKSDSRLSLARPIGWPAR